MTEESSETDSPAEPNGELIARLDKLERDSEQNRRQTERRVILAELKVEALRADMIDLDGLQFLDLNQIQLRDDGSVADARELITRLKRTKPWLFATGSSSSTAKAPLSSPTRQKLAKDMSEEEYRVARANIVKRSML